MTEKEMNQYRKAVRTAATRLLPAVVAIDNDRRDPLSCEEIAVETVDQAIALIDELDRRGFEWKDEDETPG